MCALAGSDDSAPGTRHSPRKTGNIYSQVPRYLPLCATAAPQQGIGQQVVNVRVSTVTAVMVMLLHWSDGLPLLNGRP
jgi:hypothetical protein